MTNLLAVRMHVVLFSLVAVGCASRSASAQGPPLHPIMPTEPRQCQNFGNEVLAYTSEVTKQHLDCLASNKADRTETGDSLLCSRSACQYLHDELYGDYVLSVKNLQKQMTECYEQVQVHQAEEAQKAKDEAERKVQDEKEEAEQKAQDEKDEAERDASGQRDKDESAARDAKRTADRKEAEAQREATERQAESDQLAAQQRQAYAPQSARSAQQTPRTNPRSSQPSNVSPTLVDPFKDSGPSKSQTQEVAANESMVDPFASKESLVDPFSNSDQPRSVARGKQEETWDGAKGIFQGFIDKASNNLGDMLKSAQEKMSTSDFEKFEQTAGDAHAFLGGLSKTITAVAFQRDLEKIADDPRNLSSYHDIVSDGASYGTSYVLQRISPDFLSKIYEGPVGWMASITFDASSTQTPKQDFDPMTALNNPGQYTFKQREAALQSLYESAQRHPEIWTQARYQWLYGVSDRLYNSPDNPNIHLTPP